MTVMCVYHDVFPPLFPQGVIPAPAGTVGLPFARIGEIEIDVPAKEVADQWWDFSSRKKWDSLNSTASEIIGDYGPTKRLVYLKGRV